MLWQQDRSHFGEILAAVFWSGWSRKDDMQHAIARLS